MPTAIVSAATDMATIRELWTEYWAGAGLDPHFQGFTDELAALPGPYAPPAGRLLLATVDGDPAGTAALRPLDHGRCEMKRLYVRPAHRNLGLGRLLLDRLLDEARRAGYRELYCDTMAFMQAAQRMYLAAGFERTEPYSDHPTPGAVYFRRVLPSAS